MSPLANTLPAQQFQDDKHAEGQAQPTATEPDQKSPASGCNYGCHYDGCENHDIKEVKVVGDFSRGMRLGSNSAGLIYRVAYAETTNSDMGCNPAPLASKSPITRTSSVPLSLRRFALRPSNKRQILPNPTKSDLIQPNFFRSPLPQSLCPSAPPSLSPFISPPLRPRLCHPHCPSLKNLVASSITKNSYSRLPIHKINTNNPASRKECVHSAKTIPSPATPRPMFSAHRVARR